MKFPEHFPENTPRSFQTSHGDRLPENRKEENQPC